MHETETIIGSLRNMGIELKGVDIKKVDWLTVCNLIHEHNQGSADAVQRISAIIDRARA